MTIQEVLKDLETRRKLYGIEEFKKCLEELGNPQLKLKCVHVAGTNGKGSTTNFIMQAFMQKYKVGSFTSPFLITHNDRIRINNENISDDTIIDYYLKYNALWLKYNLSSFEIDMFMAIMYFIDNNVDFCVFEVGLGGRLDATNVIDSFLAIITNIAFDHQEYLGNTLEAIAQEKAGIIKPNSTFMTLSSKHDVFYKALCQTLNTRCLIYQPIKSSSNKHVEYQYLDFKINLVMDSMYQLNNSFLALNACIEIQKHFPITNKLIENGINNAIWRGRFETISTKPLIIVDGAHNIAGIEALIQSLVKYPKVKILFSALKDKEYLTMIQMLQAYYHDITVTSFDFYRALTKSDLEAIKGVNYIDNYQLFLNQNQNYDGVIVICGSLYFISSILQERMKK